MDGRRDWRDVGRVVAAHVVMLRDAGILDESVAAALLTAMDGIGKGEPPAGVSLTMAIAAYDERLDALTAAGIVGAAAVGRGRADVAATVARLGLREHLLALGAAVDGARGALLDLGAEHVFTLMPAYAGGQAVQPTTLAHFLGGALGPLGRSAGRVRRAFDEVNRSPMGAVALASTGLPIDRERVAQLLGFDEALASTYDAVAAVDPLAEAVEAAAGVAATVRRFGTELLTWLRTEPESFRLGEGWAAAGEPGLPQFRPASGLEAMVVAARRTEGEAATVVGLLRDAPYGPAGVTLDAAIGPALATVEGAANLARRLAELVGGGLEVNRAYLANRAGRDHTTSSELADFLVAEEGLDPASARAIATMTVRKAMEQGIEASGITPELIDASALLVIGRELGVEIERIGRALAPRRFLERRGALGSPAPEATRAYLEAERDRLAADKRWRAEAEERIEARSRELERAMGEIVDAA